MAKISFFKVTELPADPIPNALYFVSSAGFVRLYVTEEDGDPRIVTIDGAIDPADSPKTLTIENPSNVENIFMFFTDVPIRVNKLFSVIVGGPGSNITWTIRFAPDRSAVGTELITGGTTTSSTVGVTETVMDVTDIPANSAIWLTTTATTGTIDQLSVSMIFEQI